MELQYYGGNCLRISTKKASIVFDDNLASLGLKSVTKSADISVRTSDLIKEIPAFFNIDMPGEYEVADVAVHGISARAHMDEENKTTATIYVIEADDFKVAVMGHVFPDLSEDQLEQIGMVDIMVVPVGGHGYTLDGTGALKLIKKIEPKIVIPTHYEDKAVNYEVPQSSLEEALKGLAMDPVETVAKFKPKTLDLTDTTHLVVLERQ